MAGPRTKKRLVVAAAVVAALVGVAAAWWFLWVPTWRPPLDEGERYGIDVSAHQGPISWEAVARDDIDWAYIKASEGGDFVDRHFADNWRDAAAVGIERGAYHFFTLCRPGADQARHFLAIAPPEPDTLPPAVDLELVGNCSRRPNTAIVHAELRAFIDAVEAAWGRPMVFYVGAEWEDRYPVHEEFGRPLWLRRFQFEPSTKGWHIWQLHGYARVDGVDGGVDLNVMRPRR